MAVLNAENCVQSLGCKPSVCSIVDKERNLADGMHVQCQPSGACGLAA